MEKVHVKTSIKLAVVGIIALLLTISLMACGNEDPPNTTPKPTQLSAPTGLQVTGTVLMWNAVANASSYSVQINENAPVGNGQATAYSLPSLSNGTYSIKVKAVGDGTNYTDSNWSSISHTVGGGGEPVTNFTVQFNTDGGSSVQNQTVAGGGLATRPASNPTKSGYTFDNWYSDAGKTVVFDFTTQTIIADTTIYVKWITNSSEAIDEYTFALAENFASYELVSYNGNVKQTTIPRMYDNLYVRVIRAEAFKDNKVLESVEIPDSIHTIGASAFEGCTALKTVTIPKNVITVSDKTFFGCSSLGSAQIASESIGASAFEECRALKTATLSDDVRTLGARVFYNCSSLLDMVLPDTVTSIGAMGFRYCTDLPSIKLSENLTQIANSLLAGCSSLKTITIPAKVASIGESALSDCTGLEKITILGDALTQIQNAAFYNCTSLNEIFLDSKASFAAFPADNYIFYNGGISGTGITVTFGKNITSIPNTLFVPYGSNNLPKITKIVFEQESGYTTVQSGDFAAMPSLSELILPDSITEVPSGSLTTTPWFAKQANGLVYAGKVLAGYKGPLPPNQTATVAADTMCIAEAVFENCAVETLILPFVGANRNATGTKATLAYLFGGTVPQSLKNVTANGQQIIYTITFDENGGDALAYNTTTVIYGEPYFCPVPTKAGYVFVGWCSAASYGTKYADASGASLAKWLFVDDQQFFAQWHPVSLSVSAGSSHSLAIDGQGNLWAWGRNNSGQLGDGTAAASKSLPVQVNTSGRMNNAKAVAVAAGNYHSLAIDEHGNLWAWGNNSNGQLGDGTITNRSLSVQVNASGRMNNAKVVAIAAGNSHSLAIDEYGNLWAWGYNSFGQLGDGTAVTSKSLPVQINTSGRMNNAKVTAIAAENSHSLAIDEHGNLWAWGLNSNGQLGDGTITNRSLPVQINTSGRINNAKVTAVAAGSSHSLAVDEYGNLWAWGINSNGQLGDGTITNRSLPVQINTSGRINNAKVVV
ncbi:MAG: leucine-rich repeat protein, partial [Firmicutes bacterium]|nr:leucine-rich repeat protein [Bacillota bacterium]